MDHLDQEALWAAINVLIKQGEQARQKAERAEQKAEREHKKSEEFYLKIGQHLKVLKEAHDAREGSTSKEWGELLRAKANLSTGRANEIMQIAEGRMTLAQLRENQTQRRAVSRARQKQLSSGLPGVPKNPPRTVTEPRTAFVGIVDRDPDTEPRTAFVGIVDRDPADTPTACTAMTRVFAVTETDALKEELAEAKARIAELEAENARMKVELARARARIAKLEQGDGSARSALH